MMAIFKFLFIFVVFPLYCSSTAVTDATNAVCPNDCSCRPDYRQCKNFVSCGGWSNDTSVKVNAYTPSIDFLDLSGSSLSRLLNNAFTGLTKLIILDLSWNDISSLPDNAFTGLETLLILDLSENDMSTLAHNLFSGLSALKELYLSNNRIGPLEGNDVFTGLKSLNKLDFSENDITKLKVNFTELSALEELDLSQNDLLNLQANTFTGLVNLTNLDLSKNKINTLESDTFIGLSALIELDLTDNSITKLTGNTFIGLAVLTKLNFKGNTINTLENDAFTGLSKLEHLDLSERGITTLESGTFTGMNSLKTLELYNNKIRKLPANAFVGLNKLEKLDLKDNQIGKLVATVFTGLGALKELYLQNNQINSIAQRAFDPFAASLTDLNLEGKQNTLQDYRDNSFFDLTSLKRLYSEFFSLCCLVGNIETCEPDDTFSSCADLLKKQVLRILMMIIGISSLIGNIVVIVSRRINKDNTVDSILISNLAVSDMLMAIYLIIIAGADLHYRGTYAKFARKWKSSFLCSFAGAISTLSGECSVTTLMVMSIDRAINIVYPFSTKRLNRTKCRYYICIAWLVWISLSFLPVINKRLIDIEYFGDHYYGQQSVCLALPLTRSRWPGWEYATAIFIAFNSLGFIVIASSYLAIFFSVRRSASTAKRRQKREEQIRIAKKLAFIIFTDFCCWCPVIVMAIGSEMGLLDIPDDIYVWSATFILPINSAVNPYLYTIVSLCDKKFRKRDEVNLVKVSY